MLVLVLRLVRRLPRVVLVLLVSLVPLVWLLLVVTAALALALTMALGRVLLVRRLVIRPRALRVLVHELRSERS
ncbi:hypothetical protein WKI68_17055 [Streptomyces sp. MS1.HAVA.3]|uniref:Uncharacterized protein n=1 Tax=Streptomyces caledonius TaxID=3134107 RepID=A0ABU8U452_9ACTN